MSELQTIHDQNRLCTSCSLRSGCHQVVPGVGNAKSPIVLIGEAPGADEDVEGVPFYGRSGKLLTKLLLRATLDRKELYITNVVCCRPPGNKLSKDEFEIKACKKWLWQKLQLVQPKIIVCLGKVPTRLLLKTKKTIKLGDYVGKPHKVEYLAGTIYPWWHPSYLLQHGRKFEEDTVKFFQEIKQLV